MFEFNLFFFGWLLLVVGMFFFVFGNCEFVVEVLCVCDGVLVLVVLVLIFVLVVVLVVFVLVKV